MRDRREGEYSGRLKVVFLVIPDFSNLLVLQHMW